MLHALQNFRGHLFTLKRCLNALSANPTKWSNTLKKTRRLLPKNCLSVFDHFVGLALKGLRIGHSPK